MSKLAYALRKTVRRKVPKGYQNLARLMIHWGEELDKCHQWNDAGMNNKEIDIRTKLFGEFSRAFWKDQKEFKMKRGKS